MPSPINLVITIDGTHLREQFANLTNYQFKQAVSRGINKTAMTGRTVARAAVKQVYTITQKGVSNAIDIKSSTPGTLTANILASAKPVPIQEFKHQFISTAGAIQKIKKRAGRDGKTITTSTRTAKRNLGTFTIEAFKGRKVEVPYAFIIPTSTRTIFGRGIYKTGGNWGFRIRQAGEPRLRTNSGGTNEKVTPLTSVTVHAAAINKNTQMLIATRIESVFLKNIEHELNFKSGMYAGTP